MTHKEENIVNISMMAAELLKDGRIERDDISGHVGLTETVISLAEQFEKETAGVYWDAGNRDYWEEIDSFAEKELLDRYGVEREEPARVNAAEELNIKVIISDGIVEGALKNANVPVSVEIVDVDEFYENYEERKAYREELYKDRSLMPCDYAFMSVEAEMEPAGVEFPKNPVVVFAVSGSVKRELFSGTFDECKAFCHEHRWIWLDENEFEWTLDIEDSREGLLPDNYYDAIYYYETKFGRALDGELTRANAEKLVLCYHHELDFNNFDFWVRYEEICGEALSYDEYKAAAASHGGDPYDIGDEDFDTIGTVKRSVKDFRTAQLLLNKAAELDQLIHAAKAQRDNAVPSGTAQHERDFR